MGIFKKILTLIGIITSIILLFVPIVGTLLVLFALMEYEYHYDFSGFQIVGILAVHLVLQMMMLSWLL